MRPLRFELGPLEVSSYATLVALGFLAAWLVIRHELARRAGRGKGAGELVLAAALGGLLGARAYRYVEHAGDATLAGIFSADGFTWYGGVLGGAAGRARRSAPHRHWACARGLSSAFAERRCARFANGGDASAFNGAA